MRRAIWTASLMLALAGGGGPGPVDAQTRDVVVLTSFPKELFEASYHGHLIISVPSRSGTTHLAVGVILQAYGWDKGWALLSQMGGNMGSITERSFGVPEAVIDFFGLSAIASGHPVDFDQVITFRHAELRASRARQR